MKTRTLIIATALVGLAGYPGSGSAQQSPALRVAAAAAQATAPAPAAVPYVAMSERAEKYYIRLFGVDEMRVRRVSSGSMLEFRYRVVEAEKAKLLSDKRAAPILREQKSGIKVGVPFMENVGTLRQAPTPQDGKEYWMLFENPSKRIQTGSHVEITIGGFHVSGLVVQ